MILNNEFEYYSIGFSANRSMKVFATSSNCAVPIFTLIVSLSSRKFFTAENVGESFNCSVKFSSGQSDPREILSAKIRPISLKMASTFSQNIGKGSHSNKLLFLNNFKGFSVVSVIERKALSSNSSCSNEGKVLSSKTRLSSNASGLNSRYTFSGFPFSSPEKNQAHERINNSQ